MDEGAAVVELVAPSYDDGLSSADCISIKWSNQGMHSWEGWPFSLGTGRCKAITYG
jgi:hypothetical protein